MDQINIELRMFMTFKQYLPEGSSEGKAKMSLDYGATFEDLLNILNMPIELIKIVIINGIIQVNSDAVIARVLKEGDTISIFPPVGGG